jgi:hypothetical protein
MNFSYNKRIFIPQRTVLNLKELSFYKLILKDERAVRHVRLGYNFHIDYLSGDEENYVLNLGGIDYFLKEYDFNYISGPWNIVPFNIAYWASCEKYCIIICELEENLLLVISDGELQVALKSQLRPTGDRLIPSSLDKETVDCIIQTYYTGNREGIYMEINGDNIKVDVNKCLFDLHSKYTRIK